VVSGGDERAIDRAARIFESKERRRITDEAKNEGSRSDRDEEKDVCRNPVPHGATP
jgi:hypothetical protein